MFGITTENEKISGYVSFDVDLQTLPTKGSGYSALHAILGEYNEDNDEVSCPNINKEIRFIREEIKKVKDKRDSPIFRLIFKVVEAAIISKQPWLGQIEKESYIIQLNQKYDNWKKELKKNEKNLWSKIIQGFKMEKDSLQWKAMNMDGKEVTYETINEICKDDYFETAISTLKLENVWSDINSSFPKVTEKEVENVVKHYGEKRTFQNLEKDEIEILAYVFQLHIEMYDSLSCKHLNGKEGDRIRIFKSESGYQKIDSCPSILSQKQNEIKCGACLNPIFASLDTASIKETKIRVFLSTKEDEGGDRNEYYVHDEADCLINKLELKRNQKNGLVQLWDDECERDHYPTGRQTKERLVEIARQLNQRNVRPRQGPSHSFFLQFDSLLQSIQSHFDAYYNKRGVGSFFNFENWNKSGHLINARANILKETMGNINRLKKPENKEEMETCLEEIENFLAEAILAQGKLSLDEHKSWQTLLLINVSDSIISSFKVEGELKEQSKAIVALQKSAQDVIAYRKPFNFPNSKIFVKSTVGIESSLRSGVRGSYGESGNPTLFTGQGLSYGQNPPWNNNNNQPDSDFREEKRFG